MSNARKNRRRSSGFLLFILLFRAFSEVPQWSFAVPRSAVPASLTVVFVHINFSGHTFGFPSLDLELCSFSYSNEGLKKRNDCFYCYALNCGLTALKWELPQMLWSAVKQRSTAAEVRREPRIINSIFSRNLCIFSCAMENGRVKRVSSIIMLLS